MSGLTIVLIYVGGALLTGWGAAFLDTLLTDYGDRIPGGACVAFGVFWPLVWGLGGPWCLLWGGYEVSVNLGRRTKKALEAREKRKRAAKWEADRLVKLAEQEVEKLLEVP